MHGCRLPTTYETGEERCKIEGLRERTEYNIDIFLFPAHHSIVFCFRCSVYWWKESVRFIIIIIIIITKLLWRLLQSSSANGALQYEST